MASPMLEPGCQVVYDEPGDYDPDMDDYYPPPPRAPAKDPREFDYVQDGGFWTYYEPIQKWVWVPDYDRLPSGMTLEQGNWWRTEIYGKTRPIFVPYAPVGTIGKSAVRGAQNVVGTTTRDVSHLGRDVVGGTGRVVEDILTLHPLRALEDAGMGSAQLAQDAVETGVDIPRTAVTSTARTARITAGAKEGGQDSETTPPSASGRELTDEDKAIYEKHMFGETITSTRITAGAKENDSAMENAFDLPTQTAGAKENDSAMENASNLPTQTAGAVYPKYVPMDCPRAADCLGCGSCMVKSGDKESGDAPSKRACGCAVCIRVREAKAKMAEGVMTPSLECSSVTQGEEGTSVCVSKKLFGNDRERSVRLIRVDDRYYGGDSGELGKRVVLTAKGDEGMSAGGWFSASVRCLPPDDQGNITCFSEKRFGKNPEKRIIEVQDEQGNVIDRGHSVVVRAEGCHSCDDKSKRRDPRLYSRARHGYGKHGKKGYACKSAAAHHRPGCTCPSCADCGCGCKGYPIGAPPARYAGNQYVMQPEDYEQMMPKHYYDPPLSGGRAQCCNTPLTTQPSCECGVTVSVPRVTAGAREADPRARHYNPPLSGGRCVFCSRSPKMGNDCVCAQTLYDPPPR